MASTLIERDPSRCFVLLGASNVVRGLPVVLDAVRDAWGSPLDVLAAIGHGRSYGKPSCVLGRTLPGILECGLWQAWEQRPPAATAALLTDIGNDIVYGRNAEQITKWVVLCLERLRPRCEQLVMTQLPLPSIERIGRARFTLMRTVLFPRSRLTLRRAVETARELNANMVELATRYEATLVEPLRQWYGFDPIHVRRACEEEAWRMILPAVERDACFANVANSWAWRMKLLGLRPARRRLFGIDQQRDQPSLQLSDGSLLSLF